jgi:hypothetical protein
MPQITYTIIGRLTFEKICPFQIFQVEGNPHFFCKVSDHYARTIDQEISFGQKFAKEDLVMLLTPESTEEE